MRSVTCMEMVLKREEITLNKTPTGTERVSKEDVSSNLIVVATDEDEFDNAKFKEV